MFRLRSPLYAQIELTSTCNLGCAHCYNEPRFSENGLLQRVKREQVPTENFRRIAEALVRNDVFAVTLTGGEPFMERDRLYEALEALKDKNLDLTINSNLTMATEEDMQRLKDYGVSGIMTSVFSYDPQTHDRITGSKESHKRTLRGIELAKKHKLFTTANTVVSQHNKSHVYQTGIFANSLGIDSFSSAQAIPSNSGGAVHLAHALTEEDIINYLEALHKVREETGMFVKLTNPLPYCSAWQKPHLRHLLESSTCTGGRTIIQVDPFGEVKACPMVEESYGNILEEELSEIWDRMQDWDSGHIPDSCSPCDLVDICRGGCRAEAERMAGSLDSKSAYATSPVNAEKTPKVLTPGTVMVLPKDIKARKEEEGLYVLFSNYRYMVADENTARFISAVSSNGGRITLDERMMHNQAFLSVRQRGYNSGLLRREVA